jgi:hypothetical protein
MVNTDVVGSSREPAQLMEALTHKAPFLIEKLLKEQIADTPQHGEALFAEAIKYLILCHLYPEKRWDMFSRLIDEAWHQFVLFTSQYLEFCRRYFGRYVHHAPGNSPGMAQREGSLAGTFADFKDHYECMFGGPLPALWQDAKSVTLNRRVLINNVPGPLSFAHDSNPGMITLTGSRGPMMAVNELARSSLEFILRTKSFYVRELPNDLTDDEKVGLAEMLVFQHVLLLGW